MATIETISHDVRVVLRDVDWDTYLSLRDNDQNRNVRMTFDQGLLELMCPSKRHERLGYLIGRFIDEWTDAFAIPVQACRCMTFQREQMERGLEPDNCYYLAHVGEVLNRDEIDLAYDPPPDLAIEVDVTTRSRGRMEIYASLGVPEVWRWRNDVIDVHRLNKKGRYQQRGDSLALRGFPVQDAAQVLRDEWGNDDGQVLRALRKLIRQVKKSSGRE